MRFPMAPKSTDRTEKHRTLTIKTIRQLSTQDNQLDIRCVGCVRKFQQTVAHSYRLAGAQSCPYRTGARNILFGVAEAPMLNNDNVAGRRRRCLTTTARYILHTAHNAPPDESTGGPKTESRLPDREREG